jgi:hypothetical protein
VQREGAEREVETVVRRPLDRRVGSHGGEVNPRRGVEVAVEVGHELSTDEDVVDARVVSGGAAEVVA